MSDDQVTSIITAKTVGLDQLASFDSSGQAGPGVTLDIALVEVKRLSSEVTALRGLVRAVASETNIPMEEIEQSIDSASGNQK